MRHRGLLVSTIAVWSTSCAPLEPPAQPAVGAQPLLVSPELTLPSSGNLHLEDGFTVVVDPAGYLVLWMESLGATHTLWAARVGADGAPVDAAAQALATGLPAESTVEAAAGPNGTRVVSSCSDGLNLCSVRVAGGHVAGAWQPVGPLDVTLAMGFAVAALPQGDLVVYAESGVDPLLARLVTLDGGVEPPSGSALFSPRSGDHPGVACHSGGCTVCWYDFAGGTSDVTCRTLDGALQPIIASTSNAGCCPAADSHPSLAFDGSRGLLVWEDGRLGRTALYASPLGDGGVLTVQGGAPLSPPQGTHTRPSVADDGQTFWAAWQSDAGQVLLATLDASGQMRDGGSFPGAFPQLAFSAPGRGVVVYATTGAAPLLRLRVLGECAVAGACASVDAGVRPGGDGGSPEAAQLAVGCGCRSASAPAPLLLLLVLAAARRRH